MKQLSCDQARRLLGASRRDDWTTDELTALGQHLESCAACRKAQAEYREAGELVRQLPTMVPPPSFKASVFAAVQVEQQRIARRQTHAVPRGVPRRSAKPAASVAALSRIAGADTDPSLVAVRVVPSRGASRPTVQRRMARIVAENGRAVAALAAMLLMAVLGATLVPASPFFLLRPSAPVSQYTADARIAHLTAGGASTSWLSYAGQAAKGNGYLLFAQSRAGGAASPLTSDPSASPIIVEAVTGRWVIWRVGDASAWRLAANMPQSGQAITLLDSTDSGSGAPALLHGVWASGDRVLAAVTTRGGGSMVVQFDLSTGAATATVIVRGAPGFQLADPSFDGTAYYWASVAPDAAGALHSTIWRGSDANHTEAVNVGDEAFHPLVAHGTLVWLAAASAPKVGVDLDQALGDVTGTVEALDLGSEQQHALGTNATAGSLQAAGILALWHSGGKTYAYDLSAHGPSGVDAQVRDAAIAQLSDTALVWAPANSNTLDVYTTQ